MGIPLLHTYDYSYHCTSINRMGSFYADHLDINLLDSANSWSNTDIRIPENTYYMPGAGGRYTFIIPFLDLVVVKLTHYKGCKPGTPAFHKTLGMHVDAVEK